jgi:hypothetical protein
LRSRIQIIDLQVVIQKEYARNQRIEQFAARDLQWLHREFSRQTIGPAGGYSGCLLRPFVLR